MLLVSFQINIRGNGVLGWSLKVQSIRRSTWQRWAGRENQLQLQGDTGHQEEESGEHVAI